MQARTADRIGTVIVRTFAFLGFGAGVTVAIALLGQDEPGWAIAALIVLGALGPVVGRLIGGLFAMPFAAAAIRAEQAEAAEIAAQDEGPAHVWPEDDPRMLLGYTYDRVFQEHLEAALDVIPHQAWTPMILEGTFQQLADEAERFVRDNAPESVAELDDDFQFFVECRHNAHRILARRLGMTPFTLGVMFTRVVQEEQRRQLDAQAPQSNEAPGATPA